ncbi:hypothetical protein E6O75_ATG04085 [Venturia nashicola]|uniref:Uncharacterized protein n=1 Tax=Venturia nashicola TaxID=86259 RepID=A0A4Z1PME5_9PEZI|nr:hypothetical protein E6O75_ATG04085 [Venturia nashicola]
MDVDHEDFFLQIMTQALLDMESDKMEPIQKEPDDMSTTTTIPSIPSTPTQKRLLRQGHGRYDSPGISSPADSANASSNLNSPASATPRAKRQKKSAAGLSTEKQLKQLFSSPQVASHQISDQPEYIYANKSAQDHQAGSVQQGPLKQPWAPQPHLTGISQQGPNQQLAYSQLNSIVKPSALRPQGLGASEHTGVWQRNPFDPVSTPLPQSLGANQQVQLQQTRDSQQSTFQRPWADQPPFLGLHQQPQPQQIRYSPQSPFNRASAAQSPIPGNGEQAQLQQMGNSQRSAFQQASAAQVPTMDQQAQQQQTGQLQPVLPRQFYTSQPQIFGEHQQAQQHRKEGNMQQQTPHNSIPTPTPVSGMTQQFQHLQVRDQHVQYQQVKQSNQQVQHQTVQNLNQSGGESNLFLHQQIIDTAYTTYQLERLNHKPVVKLVSLSGTDVLPFPVTSADYMGSTQSDGEHALDHTKPAFASGSGSGSGYTQRQNQPQNLKQKRPSHFDPDQAFTREVPFLQLVLFVDGEIKVESRRAHHGPADNEMSLAYRCLRNIHNSVSNTLWIKLQMMKATENGQQHQQHQQQGFDDSFQDEGNMGGGRFDDGFQVVGDMSGGVMGGGCMAGATAFHGRGNAGDGATYDF